MGILLQSGLRCGNAHLVQHFNGFFTDLSLIRHAQISAKHLFHVPADGHDRIQGRHGILEDHGHIPAPEFPVLLIGKGRHLRIVELQAFGLDGGIVGEDSQNSLHGDGLSGTGLSYDADDLTLINVEIHASDSLYFLTSGMEGDVQVSDF